MNSVANSEKNIILCLNRIFADATVWVRGTRIERVAGPGEVIPESYSSIDCEGNFLMPGLFDAHRVVAARTLNEFDELVTAPLHGFRSADDYWSRASSAW